MPYVTLKIQNYDIDGPNNDGASVAEKNRAILAAAARRRDAGHNERYYDEVRCRSGYLEIKYNSL